MQARPSAALTGLQDSEANEANNVPGRARLTALWSGGIGGV
jgi:hypothetical protein